MHYIALATDYDGTIAHDGVVDAPTLAALERLRTSGRKLILVTGRELADLLRVMPRIDVFDRVVAENGAVLYRPETKEERLLAPAPPQAFVEALREAEVDPLSVGRAIVATWEPNESKVLAAIRDLGLELQITFNKGAVMVLPAGVTKESGLRAALEEIEISPHNTIAVGDAENDFAFFNMCGMPVAVGNALPMLKQAAVLVTERARGAGVEELIDRLLATDLADLDAGNTRQHVTLATALDGEDTLEIVPQRQSLLLAGSSGGGKTTLTTGLLEGLAAAGFQVLVIDPEGDYDDLDIVISAGSAHEAPRIDKIVELLRKSGSGVAVNLLGVKLPDRPAFFASLLPELLALRARTGRPHFVVVDEAHHLLPHGYDPGAAALPADLKGFLFVTVGPEALSTRVVHCVDRMMAVNIRLWRSAAAARRPACGRPWDRSVMPMTTPCAKASSPPWNASCWSGAGADRRSKPAWPASASLRAGTTPSASTPAWATARRWHTKQPKQQRRWPKPRHSHQSPPTLHQTGSTSVCRNLCEGPSSRPGVIHHRNWHRFTVGSGITIRRAVR